MRNKFLVVPLTLTLLLTTSPLARPQTGQPATNVEAQDWQALSSLKRGKKILVEFKTHTFVEGKFDGVTGTTLALRSDGKSYTWEQRDIKKVYRWKGRPRKTMVRIGAGIGMFIGTLVGAGIAVENERRPGHVSSDKDTLPAVGGFFLGTLAGAGLGALLGGHRAKLLYESK